MIMSKRLYVAYGSNLNFKQMKHRCPTAKLYGIGTVSRYDDTAYSVITEQRI